MANSKNGHEVASHEHIGLHFSHPLISESPSPDTKIRFDYSFRNISHKSEKAKENELRVELEYALHPSFSLELDIPFVFLNHDFGNNVSAFEKVEVGLKFANFAFEQHNLLLGYGIEFGFPAGDERKGIGSEHIFEIEPFLNAGYKWRFLEVISFVEFGIPINQREGEEEETELGYNLALIYNIHPRVQGILEFDGETVLSGDENGESVLNITPGVKFRPSADKSLEVGAGVSFPISDKEDFETQLLLSLFYHL